MNECKVSGCVKKYFGRGYCRMHYARWCKYKNPYIVRTRGPNKNPLKNSGICIVPKCKNLQKTRHLCSKHYGHLLKWGDPNIIKKGGAKGSKNGNWKGGVAEYPNHYEMKKLRLKKLEQENYKCQICGGKATQIHHKNKDKSDQRLRNYLAVCQKCHCAKFHRTKKTTSKYIRLIGMTLQEFAKSKNIPQTTGYYLLKHTDYFKNVFLKEEA